MFRRVLVLATALCTIGVSILGARLPGFSGVAAHTGQLALTFYVVHVWLLRRALRDWPWGLTASEMIAILLIAYAAFGLAAHLWRRRFRRGPLEALLRIVG